MNIIYLSPPYWESAKPQRYDANFRSLRLCRKLEVSVATAAYSDTLYASLNIFPFDISSNALKSPSSNTNPLSIIIHQLQLAGCRTYTMPRNFWLFSIRHTTIILVDSNLNMIQGDLRHIDRSTTITNRDAFNIECTTVTERPLPSTGTTPLGKVVIGSWTIGTDLKWLHSAPTPTVPPHPSSARHEHDIDRTSSTSGKWQTLMHL